MLVEEAVEVVLSEGCGERGIVVETRMGNYPNTDRMAILNLALETLYKHLDCKKTIERNLANALFGLSFHVQGDVDGAISKGISVPDIFLDDMVRLFLLIESIFEDEWLLD